MPYNSEPGQTYTTHTISLSAWMDCRYAVGQQVALRSVTTCNGIGYYIHPLPVDSQTDRYNGTVNEPLGTATIERLEVVGPINPETGNTIAEGFRAIVRIVHPA